MPQFNHAGINDPRPGLKQRSDSIDRAIDIMDRHAAEMSAVEAEVLEEMRKWDREYKDERLHSVPRARKHLR
ncbi:hypothetical protein [Geothermobacter hydrogeniphilus]|uniref:Uncharacterized protein n=1 Tax=Geothermobacter hydrogeniphilus TaxID=1969733 RepID=A0A1X0XW64_9BACT|nr:hypothetical protein [Geothermobacter hydrogeniphilus]ORJ57106.1 hypothetical protein B5V00_14315 [Geothermobacter hydrogeniphilus]